MAMDGAFDETPEERPPPVIDPADRISNLHKEILAHIVSFLPADQGVRTCVLARTWRNVWKRTRRLLITGKNVWYFGEDEDEEQVEDEGVWSFKNFRGFVYHLLRLRLDGLDHRDNYAPIDVCEIMFDWDYYYHVDMEISCAVLSWIRYALQCQVQSLRVDIWARGRHVPLWNMHLVSRHLMRLELRGLRFRCGSCLNFSGCPALEHLEITKCVLEDVNMVTSPSVKCLVITHCLYYKRVRLRICFPHLVSLWLEHIDDNTLVLETMPQLCQAYVSIDGRCEVEYSNDPKCMVLHGLAEAKHLVVLADDKTITFTRDLKLCPTYSKLKTLVLNAHWCESKDCSALACMLQHAPVLEKLTVLFSRTIQPKYDIIVKGRPDATGNSNMLSQQLKIVKLKCFEVDRRVVNVLIFLGTLNISVQFRSDRSFQMKMKKLSLNQCQARS